MSNSFRATALVVCLVVVAAACGSAAPEAATASGAAASNTSVPATSAPADSDPSVVATAATATPVPQTYSPPSADEGSGATAGEEDVTERRLIAGVNVAIADVELADIVFDTFDGGSVTMAEATEAQIEGLLNAIPPINDPVYIAGADTTWLTDNDLVLGYVADDGTTWAYPHRVLNFHEIVNTELAGRPVAITYCPLCGSGVVFDRRPNDLRHEGVLTFDNTSALYQNDMVMVDAETKTYWWHVAGRGLVGNLTGTELTVLPARTTTWSSWLDTHPETMVLSNDQGRGPRYEFDPFADYGTVLDTGRTTFPVNPEAFADGRLSPSTRVIGFEVGDGPAAVAVLANQPAVVPIVGDPSMVVLLDGQGGGALFDTTVNGSPASFEPTELGFRDLETGSTWNSAGLALDGPAAGSQLTQLPSRTAFWYAWVSTTTDATPTQLFTP